MALVDLHIHLLPGVDDGPPDETASLVHAERMAIDAAGIPLRLHPGGEIFPGGAETLGPAELDAIAHGPPGARWVLLEVPFDGIDAGFLDACRHVRGHGFGLLDDGHGGTRSDTLAAGTHVRRGQQLTEANPRFLLTHGIPAGPSRDALAWRSPHERRVRAAIAAARRVVG